MVADGERADFLEPLERINSLQVGVIQLVSPTDDTARMAVREWVAQNGGLEVKERPRTLAGADGQVSHGVATLLTRRVDERHLVDLQRLHPEIPEEEVNWVRARLQQTALSTIPLLAEVGPDSELFRLLLTHRQCVLFSLNELRLNLFVMEKGEPFDRYALRDLGSAISSRIRL